MRNPESFIKAIGEQPLPPVEEWDPEYCGEMDLLIKADGTWFYNGTPFTRQKMKLLFSRVIKKENDNYFLVTPVEKLAIKVEWMPFTITDFNIIKLNNKPVYQFYDQLENTIQLKQAKQIKFSQFQSQQLPIINIRRNLYASFSRSCYYRLIGQAEIKSSQNNQPENIQQVSIISNGLTFSLGEFDREE